jgi:hypothetical protein
LIFEKSGVSSGRVLGLANGLEAGREAEAVVVALRFAAASAGAVVTTASAVAPRRMVRIIVYPEAK